MQCFHFNHFRIFITDEGAGMENAVELIGDWKKELGAIVGTAWVHCNTHVEPALKSALTKVLIDLEKLLGKTL